MQSIISVKKLSKDFGSASILKEIDIEIKAGNCYLLLGKNGSGKTTLIRCIIDLLKPTTGDVFIQGMQYHSNAVEIKKILGVVSEDNPLIMEFSAYQYLKFIGLLHKIPPKDLTDRIESVFEYFFEYKTDLHKKILTFSTGMKKKLSMCAAILHNPKVLILDEPFSGLDVYSVKMFISFLKTYMQQDKCILFTSHSFEHLKDFVTHIAIIEHQTIIYNDTIMAFTNNGQTQMDAALLHQLQYKTDENHKKLNFLK